jgi:hypothetical protein
MQQQQHLSKRGVTLRLDLLRFLCESRDIREMRAKTLNDPNLACASGHLFT